MNRREKLDLLIIDPQWDFCDPRGALYVQGAEKDMQRLADMIKRLGNKINQIYITLDCHYLYDIAHPDFWMNSEGQHPTPFTIISYKDVVDGVWFPIFQTLPFRDPDENGKQMNAKKYVKMYTKALEDSGRYPLCLWPPHCLIGTIGNTE